MTNLTLPDSKAENKPNSVSDWTSKNIATIADLEKSARVPRSRGEDVIDAITCFFGQVSAVYLHLALFTTWILFNTVLPKAMRFDPYPFEFMVLTLSLEAIFLSIFILITQSRQSEIDERRNQLDLQINLLAEQENTKVIWMLRRLAEKLDVDFQDDPDLQVLEESTQPETLIQQIDASTKENGRKSRK